MDLPAYYQTRVASINENDLIKPRLGKKNFFRLMAFRGQFAIARLGYLAQKKANDIEDKLNYRLLDKVLEIQELRRKIKNLIVWEDYAEIIKVLEKTHSLPKDLKYVLILAKKTLSLENTLALPTVCEKECSDVYAAIEQNNWPLALELCQNDLLKPLLVNINNFINELNWNSNDVALDLKNQDFAIDYIFSMCGIANIEEVISYVNQNGLAAAQQHFNFDAAQQQIIIACLAYYAYKEKLNNLGDNYLKMLKHKETKNNKVKAIVSYIEKNKKLFRNCHDTSRTLKKE